MYREAALLFLCKLFESLDREHLLWLWDYDGKQIPDSISYMGAAFDSEMSQNLIAAYWAGRVEGWW
jgi:hypothetical protein